MEVTEKQPKILKDKNSIEGVWELKIDVKNKLGTKAFGGRMLTAYRHPLTGKKTYLMNVDGQRKIGFNIEKPTMVLHPEKNIQDKIDLMWLLAHPEVGVQGVKLEDTVDGRKRKNPSILLKNVDRQEMSEIEEEDYIDKIIGRLSEDSGPKAIGIERLRYLLAYFNLPYFDVRYITNRQVEKRFLRKKLKNFARKINPQTGKSNSREISDVLDDIDSIKMHYEIKEMMRLGIIKESYGSYKYNNVPLGTSIDTIIKFLISNPDVYAEMNKILVEILKEQGF